MKPIRLPCHIILPATYDDSLSYYEQVCRLVEKVNETIEALNDVQAKYTEILSYYENIGEIIETTIDAKYAELKADVERELAETETRLNAKMAEVLNKVNSLESLVTTFYENSKAYTDTSVSASEARLRGEINELIGQINLELDEIRKEIADGMKLVKVYNPTTGFKSDIETCLSDIYEAARVNEGLSVSEYSGYGLTVNEYSAYGMSVEEYAMIGKKVIEHFYKWFFNPFTGLKNTVANIASWCATETCGTYTVSEYDALNLSVTDYEALDYTVRKYLEVNRANRQVLTLNGNGLTSNQYDSIGVTNL